jgi:hypothetical protein
MASPVSQIATASLWCKAVAACCLVFRASMVMRRLSTRRANAPGSRAPEPHRCTVPERGRLYADMARLFRQDLANVEAGIYPLPATDGSLPILIERSRLFFEDLPEVHRRREAASTGRC